MMPAFLVQWVCCFLIVNQLISGHNDLSRSFRCLRHSTSLGLYMSPFGLLNNPSNYGPTIYRTCFEYCTEIEIDH